MFKPRRPGGEVTRTRWQGPSDDFLFLDGRTIASASFRMLIWCAGHWSDPVNRQPLLAVFDLFRDRWGTAIHSLTQPDSTGRSRSAPVSAGGIAALREGLGTASGLARLPVRLACWIDEPHHLEVPPCLRLESLGGTAVLAIELPPDAPDLMEFADQVTRQALRMGLCCGIMGFGFFLPSYLESLLFALPMTTSHLTAAIEIAPLQAASCIRPDGGARDGDDRPYPPGLPDIGWRTLIGPPFKARLPDLAGLCAAPGITVRRQEDRTVITAGEAPVWGRAQQDGPPLQALRLVAQSLRPLRVAPRLAEHRLFGDDTGDPDRIERVRAYLHRFDR